MKTNTLDCSLTVQLLSDESEDDVAQALVSSVADRLCAYGFQVIWTPERRQDTDPASLCGRMEASDLVVAIAFKCDPSLLGKLRSRCEARKPLITFAEPSVMRGTGLTECIHSCRKALEDSNHARWRDRHRDIAKQMPDPFAVTDPERIASTVAEVATLPVSVYVSSAASPVDTDLSMLDELPDRLRDIPGLRLFQHHVTSGGQNVDESHRSDLLELADLAVFILGPARADIDQEVMDRLASLKPTLIFAPPEFSAPDELPALLAAVRGYHFERKDPTAGMSCIAPFVYTTANDIVPEVRRAVTAIRAEKKFSSRPKLF